MAAAKSRHSDPPPPPAPLSKILRSPEVRALVGLSETTIWREVKAGRFPPPLRLTPHTGGWREADIREWLASRKPTTER